MADSNFNESLHAYCLKRGYIFLKLIIRHQNNSNANDFYIAGIWSFICCIIHLPLVRKNKRPPAWPGVLLQETISRYANAFFLVQVNCRIRWIKDTQ